MPEVMKRENHLAINKNGDGALLTRSSLRSNDGRYYYTTCDYILEMNNYQGFSSCAEVGVNSDVQIDHENKSTSGFLSQNSEFDLYLPLPPYRHIRY